MCQALLWTPGVEHGQAHMVFTFKKGKSQDKQLNTVMTDCNNYQKRKGTEQWDKWMELGKGSLRI